MRVFFFILFLLCIQFSNSQEMPAMFSDNMVLQQADSVLFWGKDQPGQVVKISTGWGSTMKVQTAEDSIWETRVPTIEAGGPYKITVKGSDSLIFKNVLLGEVWFAAGQSNMDMPLGGFSNSPVNNSLKTIINSNNDKIRFFKSKRNASLEPLENVVGTWEKVSPRTSRNFSAVAYYFATQLQSKLDVPIGIITSSWGGSKVQAWMPKSSIVNFKNVIIPNTLNEEISVMRQTPTALFNAMVNPFKNYSIKGFLWYQGESDRSNQKYQQMFSDLINSWRLKWNNEQLPFYFVQIAPYDYGQYSSVAGPNAAMVREAQLQTFLNIPNTGMVVTTDAGDCKDVHPANKEVVGERLAYWALADSYGWDIPHQSPIFKSARRGIEPGEIILNFDHAEMGFIQQHEIKGFTVADQSLEYLSAQVRVNKDKTISIWNENVKEPMHIRYGYEDCPNANLKNTFNLPAAPFQTSLK